MPSRKKWTGTEIRTLKQIYKNNFNTFIAHKLGRTEASVQAKASSLGLRKSKKRLASLNFGW